MQAVDSDIPYRDPVCRHCFRFGISDLHLSEEDKRATTNMQNGLVFSLYFFLLSFRLFELKQ